MSKNKSRIYQFQAENLRKKLDGRDYILGLDLGVGSIGSAVVALDQDKKGDLIPADVVYSGSRIFTASTGSSKRRSDRGQRNSLRHRRNRLKWLWKVLSERGLMLPYEKKEDVPDPSVLMFSKTVRRESPYEIRLRELTEKVSLEELGYAIYHLANHRGSSSVFGEEEDKKEKSEKDTYSAAISKTAQLISKTNSKTFIELLQMSKVYRNTYRVSSEIAPMPTRDLIINEFEVAISTQSKYYPSVLDQEFVARIREAVFYENPMIIPEPGNCPYFPTEKKLPKIALINEERRLWEAINNIRFSIVTSDRYGRTVIHKNTILSDEQRNACFDILYSGKDLTESVVKRLLGNNHEVEDIVLQGTTKKTQRIQGFRYCSIRDNSLFKTLSEEKQVELLMCYQNSISEEGFFAGASALSDFSKEDLKMIIPDLPKKSFGSYATCGLSAMKTILPYIQNDRLSFHEAVSRAIENGQLVDNTIKRNYSTLPYYGKVLPDSLQMLMGKAWHSTYADIIGSLSFCKPETSAEEEQFGKIANPVVHQTLNELRKLVNELIEIFGKKPRKVRIETAKELKVGQKVRESIANNNAKKTARNKKIFTNYCVPHGLNYSYVKKFRIWEDQNMICPYCLTRINSDDIVYGRVDFDHIFPRDDVPGNPENNLVVGHKTCNETIKGKRIPYAAFSDDVKKWNQILQNADLHLRDKKWRFEMTSDEYEKWKTSSGMLSRFKTDNSYISTISKEYLSCLFSEDEVRHLVVDTVKGSETAILRKAWQLQSITTELAKLHNPEIEDSPEKVRADVRHHALDALVISYSTKGQTNQINTMSAHGYDNDSIQEQIRVPKAFRTSEWGANEYIQKANFAQYIRDVVFNKTFVSRKIDHSKNGQLLKETSYSIYAMNDTLLIYGAMKKVKKIETVTNLKSALFADFSIPAWVKDSERALLSKYIANNNLVYERVIRMKDVAKAMLDEENAKLISEGKKIHSIDEKAITKRALDLVGGKYRQINNGTLSKMFITRKPSDGVVGNTFDTGNNYCIDVYRDSFGNVKGEIVRKIDAMNPSFIPAYKKEGLSKMLEIHPYDILEIDKADSEEKSSNMSIVSSIGVPNAKMGRTFVVVTTFTTLSTGNIQIYVDSICSSQPGKASSFNLESSMKKKRPRIVTLSPAGLVKFVTEIIE